MDDQIAKAAGLLRAGRLVAFPTETVYGLGGNALSDAAAAAIYVAKGRPSFNPLIVHVASLEAAKRHALFNTVALRLAEQFWPGPLTLILPRRTDCALSLLVSAGLDSVAIRAPAHPLARALLEATQLPLAAPSANRSGHVSPTEAEHVRDELGDRVGMILDGGPCPIGVESTVVDVTGDAPVILRPGSITVEQLRQITAGVSFSVPGGVVKSPGMMERHYAPSKKLRLNAREIGEGEALLAFGAPLANARILENLSEGGDLAEAATNLFRMLRALDATSARAIAVMPVPEQGLGVAINDRLRRAAAD